MRGDFVTFFAVAFVADRAAFAVGVERDFDGFYFAALAGFHHLFDDLINGMPVVVIQNDAVRAAS